MRILKYVGALAFSVSLALAQHGHSVAGSAPVGATGHAPIGGVGSLLSSASAGSARRGGYSGSSYAATPYRSGTRYGTVQNRPFWRHDRGVGVVVPFFYGYPLDGFYDDYYSDAPPPVDSPMDPTSQQMPVQQDVMGQELQRLSAEIEDLRQQANPYLASAPPAQPDQQSEQQAAPVTVVMNNGKQFRSTNFAVMDGVFWDFSKTPARRVPMAEVNVAASIQASAAEGAEFPD